LNQALGVGHSESRKLWQDIYMSQWMPEAFL
jgi:hypothetical protein